ncbi:MAG TPA: histidine kinase dimerization/phospho-acceptor domain-containing protein [Drouetiella sp.]
MKLTVGRKLLLLVLIPLVFEYAFVAILFFLLQTYEQKFDQFEKSRQAIVEIQTVNRDIAHHIMRLMVALYTGRQMVNKEFDRLVEACERNQGVLLKAGTLRPEIEPISKTLPELMKETILVLNQNRMAILGDDSRKTVRMTPLRHLFFPLIHKYNATTTEIDEAEILMAKAEPRERLIYGIAIPATLAIAVVLSVLISLSASRMFSKDIVRRIREIEESAKRLAFRSELPPPDSGSDEVADLSRFLRDAGQVLADTRRKELAVLDVATDVICALDRGLRFSVVNEGSTRSWGYTPEELLAENLMSLHDKRDEQHIRGAFQKILESKVEGTFETQLRCKDGTLKDISWSSLWKESTHSFHCVAHDVSEKRSAERMRQRFVSIASHDMRTPLTSVSVSLSLMSAGGMGEISKDAQRLLIEADANVEQLMQLIQDLLDLEKMEAGKIDINFSTISALDVCQEACDEIERFASAADITILSPYSDSLISANHRSLVKVLKTLLMYAIKCTETGGTVSVEHREAQDKTFISVLFPRGEQSNFTQLSEFFEQRTDNHALKLRQIPLAMALAKTIVDAHHAQIATRESSDQCQIDLIFPTLVPEDSP